MKWNKDAERYKKMDDRRSGGSGAGGKAAAGGVGGLSIIGLLLYLFFGVGDGGGLPTSTDLGPGAAVERSIDDPTTLDEDVEQYVNAIISDVDQFWVDTFDQYGVNYSSPGFTFFDTPINTACGGATAAIGPHYCTLNDTVYLELGFFNVMTQQLGATGDFAPAYVLAHEWAHHVQNELGISTWMREEAARNPRIRNELSVRLELQADCLAGVWAQSLPTGDPGDRDVFSISDEDIREALNAAASVGDDRIQQQSGQRIDPESWTHGSSAQRQEWFYLGYDSGDTEYCDSFADL